jgi:uncharacterized protein YjiS (DUF1127 family)
VSTVVISTRSVAAPTGLRHIAAPFKAWLGAIVEAALRAHARRRDERTLREMADYQLRDLGIVRADAARLVREGR